MITEEQARMQFEAADRLEEAVDARRWKGLASERLMLIECEQGIMIEIELDKVQKGLRLLGTPDVTPEGLYQLELILEGKGKPSRKLPAGFDAVPDDPSIFGQRLVTNEELWSSLESLLDELFVLH